MSQSTIQLAYDGEALRTGSMDVRDLAPALLAVGVLCERSNDVLNQGRGKLSVKVRSDFKTGSFELSIDITQHLIEAARFLFSHKDQITTAKDLLTIIGLTGTGTVSLFQLIKWLRGRKAIKTTVLESGQVRIYVDNSVHIDNSTHIDNSIRIDTSGSRQSPVSVEQNARDKTTSAEAPHIDVTAEVVSLYNDQEVRRAALGVVKPLEQPGIDTFEVKEGTKVVEIIKKEDLPAFVSLSPTITHEPLSQGERKAAIVVVKPSFEDDLKWMFSDGEARFSAAMLDKLFLDRLANRYVYFTKGDVLVVRLRSTTYRTATGIKTEHEILEVLDIIHLPTQQTLLPLPTDEASETELSTQQ
jgi:hypothetical protein